MKKNGVTFCLAAVCLLLPYTKIQSQDPFYLKKSQEFHYLSAGLMVCAIGSYFFLNVPPADVQTLHRENVFGPDRFAIDLSCSGHASASDITRNGAIALPIFLAGSSIRWKTLYEDMVMYTESVLFLEGFTMFCKGVFRRPRPYAFRSTGPISVYGASSFFSGHTAAAFNGAVFAGTVFQKRYPDSPWVVPVWIIGLSMATTAAIFRVTSGNHFPTDVLAGAVVGSVTGWLIPHLHRQENRRFSLMLGNRIGIFYRFSGAQ
jgi:hypothetical protein